MKFKNLEMTGFKSFSEKTTILIEKGHDGEKVKIAMENSQTPEIHAANAFQIIDERAEGLKHLALLALCSVAVSSRGTTV